MPVSAQFKADAEYSSELLCLCKHDSRVQLRYHFLNNFTNNDFLTRMTSWIQFQNVSFAFHTSGKPPMFTIYFNTSQCDVLENITQKIYQQINSENRYLFENITILQACINSKNNMTVHNDYEICNDLELNVDMLNIKKGNESVTVADENKTFTISDSDYRVEMTFNIESEPAKAIRVSISNCLDRSPDPTCPLIALNINDFEVMENTSWMYKPNGRVFTIDEIAVFSNDFVFVCSFFSQNGTNTYVSTIFIYDKALQILNVVGVSCSLLGLFLTFIIRCIKKDLRTISGKIVMNIAAALFLAQLGTLFAKSLVESDLGCIALAALLHYMWLVAFMWMFIMSIVLFKSFRSLKSAVEHRSGKKSITMPFFCCWGLPALVVAAAMTLHIWEYAPIKFSYGDETVCWIRDEFAAFMFLGIPMATIFALNSIMFVVIVCGIYKTKMSSKKMRGASTKKDIFTNLIIFAKISCIMGLTWIFGFLASFVDEPFLWYIFVILNSFQGVFIFISFNSTLVAALFRRKQATNITNT
ncbi:putative adhesion G protein-coupled receptor E4P [Anneissia japonica]|uniref:putative adhesion G protein-coupled receptor E4P n=1 Tax=Anneissia japonica TaxID=1529436 RepID=UPI00142583CC|nr:putative adhesion G protein-coupled receptor E4P [Anneissia japonica]